MGRRKVDPIAKGRALVKEYVPKFGFGHYRVTVERLSDPDHDRLYGQSFYDHAEEWLHIELCDDDAITDEVRHHLVCHELAHGLTSLVQENAEELVCDRVARLATGHMGVTPRYQRCVVENNWPKSND